MKFKFFKKKSAYEIHKEKTDAELKSVMNLLSLLTREGEDYFDMKDFLSNKVEKAINWYIYNMNYKRDFLENFIKEIVNEKIKEKATEFFTQEICTKLENELQKLSLFDVRQTDSFQTFVRKFIDNNKAFIENKMVNIVESDDFLKDFSWDLENEIRDIAIERIKNA